ncbi:TIGR02117 family protein [Neptunitalea lumnitzerae]|uniref:TIGR02117 family protein n=1 Tax=Neptunitalea lumnitzerae TaxID=2965509 RepID=A0ABQ5MFE1_9FLAO|nr:TIGR02117 family protein [Neptunitalea sp. Y10]GLB48082.1 hypothetical protein Y10_04500 [Neptunitalea sp. Y10]
MKYIKRLLKVIAVFLSITVGYMVVALCATYIPVHSNQLESNKVTEVYIHSNGVHLDVIIPKELLAEDVLKDLKGVTQAKYVSFGWGDANFYLHTPQWSDLTFSTAFTALFLKSESLMHVTTYANKRTHWSKVPVSEQQLQQLNTFIAGSFVTTGKNLKVLIPGASYGSNDAFYKAHGSYSLFYTCNTWANEALKQAELEACLWTPFDFGLLKFYEK